MTAAELATNDLIQLRPLLSAPTFPLSIELSAFEIEWHASRMTLLLSENNQLCGPVLSRSS